MSVCNFTIADSVQANCSCPPAYVNPNGFTLHNTCLDISGTEQPMLLVQFFSFALLALSMPVVYRLNKAEDKKFDPLPFCFVLACGLAVLSDLIWTQHFIVTKLLFILSYVFQITVAFFAGRKTHPEGWPFTWKNTTLFIIGILLAVAFTALAIVDAALVSSYGTSGVIKGGAALHLALVTELVAYYAPKGNFMLMVQAGVYVGAFVLLVMEDSTAGGSLAWGNLLFFIGTILFVQEELK
jgi:hypothetical protein